MKVSIWILLRLGFLEGVGDKERESGGLCLAADPFEDMLFSELKVGEWFLGVRDGDGE